MTRRITILGATGSVGASTVDVLHQVRASGQFDFAIEALTARTNAEALAAQAIALGARIAVVEDETALPELRERLRGSSTEAAAGPSALIEAATRSADWTMAAVVGSAGLAPTLAAIRNGGVVALANKECLVSAGSLFMAEVKRAGATLLPVDSEHNAIFQVFDFERPHAIERIQLTASGGPFRCWKPDEIARATPEQAVRHPVWKMGSKISVDSASLMNKGLELIEARFLFPVAESRIEVLIHPQSVVHSLVAYRDGSVLAQLGTPDMRTPIAFTLAWPERMATPAPSLDLAAIGRLTFEAPDFARFPALNLARQALQTGGGAPTILNAANEVAVAAFLEGRIGFLDIARIVEQTLGRVERGAIADLDAVHEADAAARRYAAHLIDPRQGDRVVPLAGRKRRHTRGGED